MAKEMEITQLIRDIAKNENITFDHMDEDTYRMMNHLNYNATLNIRFDGWCNVFDSREYDSTAISYYSEKLRHTVILKADDSFEFDSIEEFAEAVIEWEELAEKIEASITVAKV